MFLNASAPDTAWVVHEQQPALIDAMKKGTKLTVTGISSRGTTVVDTYSLLGITAATRQGGGAVPLDGRTASPLTRPPSSPITPP